MTADELKLARAAYLAAMRMATFAFRVAQIDRPPTEAEWESWRRTMWRDMKEWDAGSRFLGKLCEEGA